jgi:hypothetical protein
MATNLGKKGVTVRHEPSEKTKAEVSALCTYGVPQDEIARYLGVDSKTLRRWYREELDQASTRANVQVGKFLFSAASGRALEQDQGASYADCVRAAMFWAKTRMGWSERQAIDHTSSDGSMGPLVIETTKPPQ